MSSSRSAPARFDDQMPAGAAHAFADRKMAGTVLGWLEAPTLSFVEHAGEPAPRT
jgi:hypothetical protein